MNYGNHDYENKLMVGSVENEDCILTRMEKEIGNSESNITLKMFQSIPFSESTLVIMIDTTMYDMDDNESYKDCYKYAVINDDASVASDQFENAKAKQVEFISSVVDKIINEDSFSNIVIIGHHPIIHYKIKEAKDKKIKIKKIKIKKIKIKIKIKKKTQMTKKKKRKKHLLLIHYN